MPKGFTGVYVGQVDFYGGQTHGSDSVTQGVAGVGVGSGVDEDAIGPGVGFVDVVNEDTLVVGLVDAEGGLRRGRELFHLLINLRQRQSAIHPWLSHPQQIQIWAV